MNVLLYKLALFSQRMQALLSFTGFLCSPLLVVMVRELVGGLLNLMKKV